MSYKEIQVPSSTIIEIYSKALAEVEKLQEKCKEVQELRKEHYKRNVIPRSKDYDYWYFVDFLSYRYQYYCNSPILKFISEIKSCLKAAELSDYLTMTKDQVQGMEKYKNLMFLDYIEYWLNAECPFVISDSKEGKEDDVKPKAQDTKMKEQPSPKPQKEPEPSAYAIVLPWIAILCGILFGLTNCS